MPWLVLVLVSYSGNSEGRSLSDGEDSFVTLIHGLFLTVGYLLLFSLLVPYSWSAAHHIGLTTCEATVLPPLFSFSYDTLP